MYLPKYMIEKEEEGFLSHIVKQELAPYAKMLKVEVPWRNRLFKWLNFVSLVPAISLLVLVLLSKLKYAASDITSNEGLVSAPYAVGGIVAALTGILIAILAITAQLNSLYVGGSESLFKKLLSNTHYKSVASLAVGTIVAALIGCICDGSEPKWILLGSVLILIVFACVTAIAELVVLVRAVETFGRDAARTMFVDELKNDNRRALSVELKRRIALNVFRNRLKEMGFDWFIWQPELRKGQVKYCVKKIGRFVCDVRLPLLWRLAKKLGLEPISDEDSDSGLFMQEQERPIMCVRPGQRLEKEQAALIIEGKETAPDTQRLIENAFVCRRRSPFPDRNVPWDDFADLMRRQIRDVNSGELRKVLKSFYVIVGDYLNFLEKAEIKHPEQTFPFEVEEYQPPTLAAIGFREIINNITTIRDRHCLATLIYFVVGVGQVSFGKEQGVEYYRDVLQWLSAFYFAGTGDYELSSEVRKLTAEKFRTGPFYAIRELIHQERTNERVEKIELIKNYVTIYYTRLCGILCSIWRTGDEKNFYEFLDQLNARIGGVGDDASIHYEIAEQTYENIKDKADTDSEAVLKAEKKLEFAKMDLEIQDLRYLGDLTVAAWIAEVVGAGKMDATRAKPLMNECIDNIRDFNHFIEVFLYAESFGFHDTPLNYDSWDHEERIPGKVYTTGSAFESWIQPFWILAALIRLSGEQQSQFDSSKIRPLSAFREYQYDRLENAANKIVEDKERYEWFAEDIDWNAAKERLLTIFQEIKELQKLRDSEKLLASPISQKKVEKFKADCLKGYLQKRKLSGLIKRFKGTKKETVAKSWSGKPSVVDVLDKEEFIEDWHVGFAGKEGYGDFLGQVETNQFSKWIEHNLSDGGVLTSLSELSSLVGETANRMRDERFNPRVVLLPEDHVYQNCFTSVPYWQRKSDYVRVGLPTWIAHFDGMEVFVWPRWEQACIAVLDMDKFLSLEESIEGKYAPLEIQLGVMSQERMEKILDDGKITRLINEFEASDWDVPTFAKTKMDLRLTANVRLGFDEQGAGVKLDVDESTVGVVCDKQNQTCHRIHCDLINNIDSQNKELFKTAALAVRRHNYRACEKCRPLFGR